METPEATFLAVRGETPRLNQSPTTRMAIRSSHRQRCTHSRPSLSLSFLGFSRRPLGSCSGRRGSPHRTGRTRRTLGSGPLLKRLARVFPPSGRLVRGARGRAWGTSPVKAGAAGVRASRCCPPLRLGFLSPAKDDGSMLNAPFHSLLFRIGL